MSDEIKEAPPAQPAPKTKPKPPETVKVKLIRAGSCNYEGIIMRRNEVAEFEKTLAEQLLRTGLFERL